MSPVGPAGRRRLDRHGGLDPAVDYEEIYRSLALLELAWEMRVGHQLTYYQTLAAPRVAAVLAGTGEVEARPRKRAYDTGLLMYELFVHGFDSSAGRAVVRRLNQMHRSHGIDNGDYCYVLNAFAVVPTRFINRYGRRRLTEAETAATAAFYRQLGARMNLRDLSADYRQQEHDFDAYNQRHLRPTAESRRLMSATQQALAARVPRPLAPLADVAVGVLLDQPTRTALGLSAPPLGAATVVAAALKTRAAAARLRGRREPWFTSGQPNSVYPLGYRIEDLGPPAPPRASP